MRISKATKECGQLINDAFNLKDSVQNLDCTLQDMGVRLQKKNMPVLTEIRKAVWLLQEQTRNLTDLVNQVDERLSNG